MEVAEESKYSRKKRIQELEKAIGRIDSAIADMQTTRHTCTFCGIEHDMNLDLLLKAEEQKRKLSQAIAQEMGEWQKVEQKREEEVTFWNPATLEAMQSDESRILNAEEVKLIEAAGI